MNQIPANPRTPLNLSGIDNPVLSQRRTRIWMGTALVVGLGLRLLQYVLGFPIWTDEAKLATSLLERDYAGMLNPLTYKQIAPVLFLWIQKTSISLLGVTEYSFRLVPFFAAIAGVLLMHRLGSRLFGGAPALFALAIFAVSYYPIRHSAELKPYATDLLASVVLTLLAVEWLSQPDRSRWLWIFAIAGPLSVALSYTAAFVALAVLAALAAPVLRVRSIATSGPWMAATVFTGASFAANVAFVALRQFEIRAATGMPLIGGFPPTNDPVGSLVWLLQAHTGRTFGYPIGGIDGGSIATFAAFAIGALTLWRAKKTLTLALLLGPFGLGILAALLQIYPYGGSGRLTQYLVPAICLLAGLGLARASSVLRRAESRRRCQELILGSLLIFGLLSGVWSVVQPYRDRSDQLGRDFARWFWTVKTNDGEVVCAWEDPSIEFAQPHDRWTPGSAAFRVNRHIYAPELRRGQTPNLDNVSRAHPLQIVFLGSSLSLKRPAFDAWLRDMTRRYRFVDAEHFELEGYAAEHGHAEWIEIYTFVPGPDSPETTGDRIGWAQSIQRPIGTVDYASCEAIIGWARDPDTSRPTRVEVFRRGDPHPIASVQAHIHRPGLPSLDQDHGFNFPTPAELRTGEPESFEILVYDLALNGDLVAPRMAIHGSLQTLDCPCLAPAVLNASEPVNQLPESPS